MFRNNTKLFVEVLILVDTGFDEEETIKYLGLMRQSGLATEVVGHRAGLITGTNGLTIRPDRTLVDLDKTAGLQLLILPGRTQSAMSLLTDPRVHRLFATVAADGGRLAVTNQAEEAFLRADLVEVLSDPSVISQGRNDLAAFGRHLTNLLAV